MPSPCPCRGCTKAYEAGLTDQQWAVHAYEQGREHGYKHGYDEGRILGYREGREAGKATVHDCGQHSAACCTAGYNRGYKEGYEFGITRLEEIRNEAYRDGYNAHARSRAYAEQVYGPYPVIDERVQQSIGENMGRYIDEHFNQHGKGENP